MAPDLIVVAVPRKHQVVMRAVSRHVAALRAFHAGLIAETHRHLHSLQEMAPDIETLRHPAAQPPGKLAAAEAASRKLRALERLRNPWRETYRDFRHSLRRAHALLKKIASSNSKTGL
nr:Unknown Function [uncultured bacterium]